MDFPPLKFDIPRRVSFVWKRDDERIGDCKMMEIMKFMEEELKTRKISITYNEEDDDEKPGLRIIFFTKGFFIDSVRDSTVEHWIARGIKFSVVIVDDEEREFLTFVAFCCGPVVKGNPNYLLEYDITHADVGTALGFAMGYSNPEHRTLSPGISLAEAKKFAVKYAEDIDEKPFKPLGLDYYNLDYGLKTDIANIFDEILLKIKNIPQGSTKNYLFAVFSGCPCRCFDMTTISKLVKFRQLRTPAANFNTTFLLPKKKYDQNDKLTFQTALFDMLYGSGEPGEFLADHLGCGMSRSKYFTSIEEFDISHPLALDHLTNLAGLFGRKSLIVITTYASSELLNQMEVMSTVRGTTCKNDAEVMSKCHTISLLELLELNKKEVHTAIPPDDSSNEKVDAMELESDDEVLLQSAGKKLKTTVFYS